MIFDMSDPKAVYLAPAGTPPPLGGVTLGELVAASVSYEGYEPRVWDLSVRSFLPRSLTPLQETADRRLAERVAVEDPGAAGW